MYITAPGLVCSVGLNAEAACAAMRAGIAGFDELPYRDNSGEPIIGAMVPGLDPELSRMDRLVEMLAMALTDTLSNAPDLPLETVPLIVCLAEPDRPGGGAPYAADMIAAVEERLDLSFHPTLSGAIAQGHVSGFVALDHARTLIENQDVDQCLICGVDSYINASALNWLDRHWRLKTEENSDGVIPGEASAAILVMYETAKSASRVRGIGFATEPAHILSDEPLLGLGLATSARNALAAAELDIADTSFRLSDVTGEHYGFKEQALAIARLMRTDAGEFPIWHLADCIGDTSAAAGLCQLAMTHQAFAKGFAPGPRAIGFTSSDLGARSAVVVEAANA